MSIATEITALNTNLTAAKNAVTAKGGTVGDTGLAGLATEISTIPSGGGNIVNGIIAQFKATSFTIDANMFVEFVNNLTAGTDTQLSTVSNSCNHASAVALGPDKVFIAHRNGNYLYGVVCTISGTTITVGTDTQLSTLSNSYFYASTVVLGTDKVFIAHAVGSYLYVMVCTIDGTTITPGTDTQLSTVSNSNYYISTAKLGTDRVLIARGSNIRNLYGVVCTISGTTIEAGADTKLNTWQTESTYQYPSIAVLDANKVFISHQGGSYLYGMVCTIDGTTITPGTDTQLSTFSASYLTTSPSVALASDKIFIAHRSSNNALYGMVCSISGTAITPGADIQIGAGSQYASAVVLDANKVFVSYQRSNFLYGVVCIVSGTAIIVGTDTQLSTTAASAAHNISTVALGTDKVFTAHAGGSYLYGLISDAPDITAQPATDGMAIRGLTKTECTTSTAGEVWVLNP